MRVKLITSQATLEYVIVLTALVVFILWAGVTLFRPAVDKGLTDTQNAIERVADTIKY